MHFALLALSEVIGVAYLCLNIPEMLVANFVGAAGRCGDGADQHQALRGGSPLHLRSLRREAANRRYGASAGAGPVLGSLQTVEEVVALNDPLGPASPAAAEHATSPTTS